MLDSGMLSIERLWFFSFTVSEISVATGSGFALTGSGFALTGSGFALTGSGFALTGSGFALTGSGFALTGSFCVVKGLEILPEYMVLWVLQSLKDFLPIM
jgi:hypothetical protein